MPLRWLSASQTNRNRHFFKALQSGYCLQNDFPKLAAKHTAKYRIRLYLRYHVTPISNCMALMKMHCTILPNAWLFRPIRFPTPAILYDPLCFYFTRLREYFSIHVSLLLCILRAVAPQKLLSLLPLMCTMPSAQGYIALIFVYS